MALIKCPECGKDVSNKAEQCIHCGYPLSNASENATKTPTPAKKYKVLLTEYENRIKTIEVIMNVIKMDFNEAKDLVENCPKYIAGNVSNEEFETIKQALAVVGAQVEREEMEDADIPLPQSKVPPKVKSCPTCGKSISNTATTCPFCGHSFVKENGLSFWGVVGAIIVAVLILMFF